MVAVDPPTTAPPKERAKAKSVPRPASPIDINAADARELEALPGIGPAYAKAIVAGRPYKSVDDLERVKGLGKKQVDAIRDMITVSGASPATGVTLPPGTTNAAPPRLVNINTASREELDILPGIVPVKAQAITDARPFKSIEDIKRAKGIKDAQFSLIKDRITVE